MKIFLSIVLTLLTTQCASGQISVDVYREGLTECLGDQLNIFIQELYDELTSEFLSKFSNSDNFHEEFKNNYCAGVLEDSFFVVDVDSKLDSLIIFGISKGFWTHNTIELNKPITIDGREYKITPPNSDNYRYKSESEFETVKINSNSRFVQCSKVYALHQVLSAYYREHERLGLASSDTKLCGLGDFFVEDDYNLKSLQYFIALEIICQRALFVNGYSRLFKE